MNTEALRKNAVGTQCGCGLNMGMRIRFMITFKYIAIVPTEPCKYPVISAVAVSYCRA